MLSLLCSFLDRLRVFFAPQSPIALASLTMPKAHRDFLGRAVDFYGALSSSDKEKFEHRCLSFLSATQVIGHDVVVNDEDKLLVAAGSVILAWGFPQWHYVKVDQVFLVSGAFNEHANLGEADSNITGLVGTHHLRGKMILSQAALHKGFYNIKDKRNVAIHEFAHLIDMADGVVDGLPSQLAQSKFALPWLELIDRKINDIERNRSDVRDYAATNRAEFFAVATEYFFERPKLLKRKHPEIYRSLERFYQQNRSEVQTQLRVRKKGPCPCGSGKRYKHCCLISG